MVWIRFFDGYSLVQPQKHGLISNASLLQGQLGNL